MTRTRRSRAAPAGLGGLGTERVTWARPRKMPPKSFAKASSADPAVRASIAAPSAMISRATVLRAGSPEQRLEREPLADEAAERRHRGEGEDGEPEARRGPRQLCREAAERRDRRLPAGRGDAIGGEERERLCDPVRDHVQRRGEQAGGRELRLVAGLADQGDAEADQDDARVLDAREAEEALDVVLRDRVEDADEALRPPSTKRARPTRAAPGRASRRRAARGRRSRR